MAAPRRSGWKRTGLGVSFIFESNAANQTESRFAAIVCVCWGFGALSFLLSLTSQTIPPMSRANPIGTMLSPAAAAQSDTPTSPASCSEAPRSGVRTVSKARSIPATVPTTPHNGPRARRDPNTMSVSGAFLDVISFVSPHRFPKRSLENTGSGEISACPRPDAHSARRRSSSRSRRPAASSP